MKKLLSNSYSESDSMKPDEYWEAVFQDKGITRKKVIASVTAAKFLSPVLFQHLTLSVRR